MICEIYEIYIMSFLKQQMASSQFLSITKIDPAIYHEDDSLSSKINNYRNI